MTPSDLPCDSEPKPVDDVVEGVSLRQVLHAASRYAAQPTERDAYSRLLVIYSIRLATHNLGPDETALVCLRALERERAG